MMNTDFYQKQRKIKKFKKICQRANILTVTKFIYYQISFKTFKKKEKNYFKKLFKKKYKNERLIKSSIFNFNCLKYCVYRCVSIVYCFVGNTNFIFFTSFKLIKDRFFNLNSCNTFFIGFRNIFFALKFKYNIFTYYRFTITPF